MKKMKIFASLILFVVLSAFSMTGCSSDHNKKNDQTSKAENLTLLIGNNWGSPLADYAFYENLIKDTFARGGRVTLIQMDMTPSILDSISVNSSDIKGMSKQNKEETYSLYAKAVIEAANQSLPDSNGVDVIKCLELAADNIPSDSNNRIICCSNMISTEGSLVDMTGGVDNLEDQSQEVINKLNETANIPDFSGKHVFVEVYSTGILTAQQDSLTNLEKKQIIDFYEALLTEGGAEVEFMNTMLPINQQLEIPKEFRQYPLIPVIKEDIVITNNVSQDEDKEDDISAETVVKFDDSVLSFEKDSDKFTDENKAMATLKPLVSTINDYYNAGKGTATALIGTTAATEPDGDGDPELALARVRKVSLILNKLGVDEQALSEYGLGYHPLLCKKNFSDDGEFDESAAQRNRAVFITLETNPMAEKVKQLCSAR